MRSQAFALRIDTSLRRCFEARSSPHTTNTTSETLRIRFSPSPLIPGYNTPMRCGYWGFLLALSVVACATETPPPTQGGGDGIDSGIDSIGGSDGPIEEGDDDGIGVGDEGTGTGNDDEGLAGGADEGSIPICAEVNVEQLVPTLTLLIDRSLSMNQGFDGTNRWQAVYDALMSTNGFVDQLQAELRLGLATYSASDGTNRPAIDECPVLESVAPAFNNKSAFSSIYERSLSTLIEDTPTGESLIAIAADLAEIDVQGPKGILLATDGAPDTCDDPDPPNSDAQDDVNVETLGYAQSVVDQGIQIFVLGVDTDAVTNVHLQEMANIGAGLPADGSGGVAPFYLSDNTDQLVTDIQAIVDSFKSCSFSLDNGIRVEQQCTGTVVLDGVELDCGTDWELSDSTTLELLGSTCDAFNDGDNHALAAEWPCEVYIPG